MDNPIELHALQYEGNEKSKMALHLFLQIIGKIRMGKMPRKNHWWYATEYIDTMGITTGPILYNSGVDTFTVTLNIHQNQLQIFTSKNEMEFFPLASGLSVARFYSQLMDALEKLNIEISIHNKPYDLGIDKNFNEIDEYHYDPIYAKSFWRAMLWVAGVLKEFSGRFNAKSSPVHLYWHSLDLALTRFSGKKAPPRGEGARISDKDAYSHECISFGFWAGDENMKEPAFYSYTYPSPDGLDQKPLQPDASKWEINNGPPMAILTYHDLLMDKNPRKTLLAFLESAYQAGASLAGWDIEKFKVPPLSEI